MAHEDEMVSAYARVRGWVVNTTYRARELDAALARVDDARKLVEAAERQRQLWEARIPAQAEEQRRMLLTASRPSERGALMKRLPRVVPDDRISQVSFKVGYDWTPPLQLPLCGGCGDKIQIGTVSMPDHDGDYADGPRTCLMSAVQAARWWREVPWHESCLGPALIDSFPDVPPARLYSPSGTLLRENSLETKE